MTRRQALLAVGALLAAGIGTNVEAGQGESAWRTGGNDFVLDAEQIRNIIILKKGGEGGEIVVRFEEIVEALETGSG